MYPSPLYLNQLLSPPTLSFPPLPHSLLTPLLIFVAANLFITLFSLFAPSLLSYSRLFAAVLNIKCLYSHSVVFSWANSRKRNDEEIWRKECGWVHHQVGCCTTCKAGNCSDIPSNTALTLNFFHEVISDLCQWWVCTSSAVCTLNSSQVLLYGQD